MQLAGQPGGDRPRPAQQQRRSRAPARTNASCGSGLGSLTDRPRTPDDQGGARPALAARGRAGSPPARRPRRPSGGARQCSSSSSSSCTRACSASTRDSSSMIRLMPARLTPSSCESRCTSRSSATSRGLYRRPPPGVRPGLHQAEPVVLAQRLGVHAGQLGGHGDHEDRRVLGDRPRRRPAPARRPGHRSPPACTAAVICGRGSSSISSARFSMTLRCAGRQPHRHGDVEGDEQVAGASLAGHAAAAHPQGAAARRAGGHLERDACRRGSAPSASSRAPPRRR